MKHSEPIYGLRQNVLKVILSRKISKNYLGHEKTGDLLGSSYSFIETTKVVYILITVEYFEIYLIY